MHSAPQQQALSNQDSVYKSHLTVLHEAAQDTAPEEIKALLCQVRKQVTIQRQLVNQLLSDVEAR